MKILIILISKVSLFSITLNVQTSVALDNGDYSY